MRGCWVTWLHEGQCSRQTCNIKRSLTKWVPVYREKMETGSLRQMRNYKHACVQRKDGDCKSQTDEKLQTWLCTEKRWRLEVSDRWETTNMAVYREKMENGSIRQMRNYKHGCVQRKDGEWKYQTGEKLKTCLCTEKRWRMEVSDRWETKNMPVYKEKMENGSIRQVRN